MKSSLVLSFILVSCASANTATKKTPENCFTNQITRHRGIDVVGWTELINNPWKYQNKRVHIRGFISMSILSMYVSEYHYRTFFWNSMEGLEPSEHIEMPAVVDSWFSKYRLGLDVTRENLKMECDQKYGIVSGIFVTDGFPNSKGMELSEVKIIDCSCDKPPLLENMTR